jgi:transcriptional regulator with PAS, ATPase and Fis domain
MTFDHASEFITLVDRKGKILRCNKSFANFANRQIKELKNIPYTDFIPIRLEQLTPDKQIKKIEVKTDKGRWLYLSYCPIVDKNNEFMKAIIVGSDITSLKNTGEKLLESERELKERLEELEKFYEMAVGRELRMKQIKDENKKLRFQLVNVAKK